MRTESLISKTGFDSLLLKEVPIETLFSSSILNSILIKLNLKDFNLAQAAGQEEINKLQQEN